MINVFEPDFGELEIQELSKTIESRWIGKGRKEEIFREQFSKYIGTDPENLVTYNSCTEAFFQLFEFLNLPVGSEVIVPSISFVGVANAIKASGAKIVFCDVDPRNGNPRLENIVENLTKNTRAIVYQHFGGNMTEIKRISEFCKENNLILIEDAAAALGSFSENVAAGLFGDYGMWSFDAMKSISCGDGGMLYSKDMKNIQTLKTQGYLGLDFTSGMERSRDSHDRWWNFEVQALGRRSIMNDLSATLGVVQLSRMAEKLQKRTHIYEMYVNGFANNQNIEIVNRSNIDLQTKHSHYFFAIRLRVGRDSLANYLRKNDIYTTYRYLPLHKQKIYDSYKELSQSEIFENEILLLPMHTNLTDENVSKVINCVVDFTNG